jgi:hypothetical protein
MPNNTMTIIGFMGLKRSGKDTCGDYLVANHNFVKRSAADCLKEACGSIFLFNKEQLYGDLKEVPDPRWNGATPRTVLQYVGTDLLRDQLDVIMPGLGKDVFVRHFELWVQSNPTLNVVVPDIRFQNEVDLIHKLGGIVVKVTRPSVMPEDISTLHASERELLSITTHDEEFMNDKDIPHLYSQIDYLTLGMFEK